MADTMTLAHTCEDGHTWIEQDDGGVSPSWGYGLTSVRYEQGPRACPEPARDGDGQYECAGCGGRFYCGHGTPGVMSDPWNYDPACQPPEPACGKSPARTERWIEGTGRGETRVLARWEEISPDALTNATAEGMIASASNPEPQEVPMTTKPETTAAQTVVVCGPNLSSVAQRKGDLHVHAEGCGDLKHYGPGRKFGGDTNGEQEAKLRVSDLTEIAEHCYSDQIAESGDHAEEYLSSFHFAPCVKLPETAPTPISDETLDTLARAGVQPERIEAMRANRPETVTLTSKGGNALKKGAWHMRNADSATVTTLCGLVLQEDTAGGISVHIVPDIDRRVVRYQNQPVCSNCSAQFNNGNTTTEEVNMSTTAATASTEAKPDPKNKTTGSGSGIKTQSGPGRGSATRSSGAAPAAKTETAADPAVEEGLDKALIAQIKRAVPKHELKTAPSGAYTVVKTDGLKIATLHPQGRKGALVLLAVSPSKVKQTVKGADVEKYEKNVIKSRVYITTSAQAEQVARVLAEEAKALAAT